MDGLKPLAVGWQPHRAGQASGIVSTENVQRPRRRRISRSRHAKQGKQQHGKPAETIRTCAQTP
jgi:hypothetical protein